MVIYPNSVCIEDAWVDVGSNTPFPEFRGLYITGIEVTDIPDSPVAIIEIAFTDDSVMRVRTNEYMIRYKK